MLGMMAAVVLIAASPQIQGHASQASGRLTITAVVNSSSTLIIEPDGTTKMIIANAPADEAILREAVQLRQMPHAANAERAQHNHQHIRRNRSFHTRALHR